MLNVRCFVCGNVQEECLELHHLVPRVIGGTDADGRVFLCKFGYGCEGHSRVHDFLFQEWGNVIYVEEKYYKNKIRESSIDFIKSLKKDF